MYDTPSVLNSAGNGGDVGVQNPHIITMKKKRAQKLFVVSEGNGSWLLWTTDDERQLKKRRTNGHYISEVEYEKS